MATTTIAASRAARPTRARRSIVVASASRTTFSGIHGRVEHTNPYTEELRATAKYIARRGHGILAADESNATTNKRLQASPGGFSNPTEETRRAWREVLLTTPCLGKYISGTILFDETTHQSTAAGVPFLTVLEKEGIKAGIKLDTGLQPLPGTDGETATQGLDGLADRCRDYYARGIRFAKWRAVLNVGGGRPSTMAIEENAHALARYAQIAQQAGLVPIVEPEVTLGEGDYSIDETAFVSERVYSTVFRWLNLYSIDVSAILLKPNMILPGLDAPAASPEAVAAATTRVLSRTIPPAVPGIHFLSGGMSEYESTVNLLEMQKAMPNAPWSLTFSYGRALQAPVLKKWAADPKANFGAAQELLLALAKVNSEAQLGTWKGDHPVPSKLGEGRILQALRLGGAGK